MCKIVAFTNATKLTVNDKLLNILKAVVTPTERDGFGYSVQGEKGHYGERTVDVVSRFNSKHGSPDYMARYRSIYTETQNTFGVKSKVVGSLIAHGRFSTNSKGLNCAHPFTDGKLTLIHNGVVSDIAPNPIKTETPNDSEIIFRYWQKGGLTPVVDNVSGYYALAIQEDKQYLHIVKDDTARLVMAWSPVIGSLVFATTKDILEQLNKALKLKLGSFEVVKDNTHIVFNLNTIEHQSSFVPIGQTFKFDDAMLAHSLNRSDDPFYYADKLDNDVSDDLVQDVIDMKNFKRIAK